ncbi:MAG: AbgT family transporter [Acidobacteriota bacterium]|nr:AbgT family transporter [Acidobacteriota bacterium]
MSSSPHLRYLHSTMTENETPSRSADGGEAAASEPSSSANAQGPEGQGKEPGGGEQPQGIVYRFLNLVERVGNLLPDPAMLFLIGLILTWVASWLLSGVSFDVVDPRTTEPIQVMNLLTGSSLAAFLAGMVNTFASFPPLGLVLVALLGVGVAEHTGFINASLKALLGVTHKSLLTPVLILVACVSHTAADAGYVLVIPLGGVIFYAAGRHPLAGIAAAFAGVSGGFSANFVPSGIDPLLQSFTQSSAQILNPELLVNPLCNIYFTAASTVLVVFVGWFITDRIVEPRLAGTPVELEEDDDMPDMSDVNLSKEEKRGLFLAFGSILVLTALLVLAVLPETSPLRSPDGQITAFSAPLMRSIVPLIFIFFIIPGVLYGYGARSIEGHRDIVQGMTKSMHSMGYYIVMAFFAALFIAEFGRSGIGALIALEGAAFLKALGTPGQVTIVGIIFLTAIVNLLVGSASAKWALLSPIFVPMLMELGLSPELTQAAYRVGDSTTNIITPLMPYFPLIVVFCRRYDRKAGIGTLVSTMLPYSVIFLVVWSAFLLLYWAAGIPLGLQAAYVYPAG